MRVAAGDTAAFGEVLRRYQERVVNLVHRIVGDWDTALDLAQECFLRVFRRAETFQPDGNARAWLLAVAVNLARDPLRRRPRVVALEPHLERGSESAGGVRPRGAQPPAPAEMLEQEELRARVRATLGELPELHRAVLVLRDLEGLSYEEMALLLGLEIGTVKSRLHRARKQFEETYRRREGGR